MTNPLKGRPFTASALISAVAITALFIAVWAVSDSLNIISSLVTLGIWWLGAAIAAAIEEIAQEEKGTNEHR